MWWEGQAGSAYSEHGENTDRLYMIMGNIISNMNGVQDSETPLVGNLDADAIIRSAAEQPTQEEMERRELVNKLLQYRVSAKDEFPPEVCLLEVDGVPFFAKGDIHAIKAKQKQGKTNAIAIMVAAILCGKWGRLKGILEGAKVLVIDTEQKNADTQLVYNRTLELAGLPKEDIYERFLTFAFRALDTEQKLNAVKALIMEFKPDIVFVDGVVDLMGNFNEVDDSKAIIEELLRMTTKEVSGFDPAIVCVLHTNKAAEDHNMRGHAGTMLAQKAGNVFEVKKDNHIITVYNSDSRHQEVPSWSFMFDAQGNIIDADAERNRLIEEARVQRVNSAAQKAEVERNERIQQVVNIVIEAGGKMPIAKLKSKVMSIRVCSRTTAERIIKDAIENKRIVSNKELKYVAIPIVQDVHTDEQTLNF